MALKRISPNLWFRIKGGKKSGVTAFLGTAGLVSAAIGGITATGIALPMWSMVSTGIGCAVIGTAVAYIRGREKFFSPLFLDEMSLDGQYTCKFSSRGSLREACEMTKPFYKDRYVSHEIVEQWRIKNPKGFVEITNSDGILCACFGLLAITDSFMDQLIAGTVSDDQLGEDSIYSFEESRKVRRIYITGVVVRDSSTWKGNKRACVMLWAIMEYLKNIYGLERKRQLFAIAVTEEAERLMKKLKFKLLSPATNRVDECNMYEYQLSKKSWKALISRVGNFSMMCKCEF